MSGGGKENRFIRANLIAAAVNITERLMSGAVEEEEKKMCEMKEKSGFQSHAM